MNTTTQTSLGALVAQHPAWAPVMESLGLDYCCGGHRTLDQAAGERGLDAETVLRTLKALPLQGLRDSPNAALLETEALIEHIVTQHHSFVRRELPRLTALALKVTAAHGAEHAEAVEMGPLVTRLAAALDSHLKSEEEVLFPALRSALRSEGPLDTPRFASFFEEHEEAGDLVHRLAHLTEGFSTPAWGCPTYRSLMEGLAAFETDLHQHVHLENNVLFPRFGGHP